MQRSKRVLVPIVLVAFLVGAFAWGAAFTPRSGPAVAAIPANQAFTAFYREATLDTANVITVDEATTGVTGWANAGLVGFFVTCTEDSGTATLDVALQRSIDGGTTWVNIIAMTQLAATGSETKLYADVRTATAQIIGDRLRVNYDVTGSGQYTCSSYLTGEA